MDGLILETTGLPHSYGLSKPEDAAVFVYSIVDSDTNGDARLTDSDKVKVAISRPDGADFRIVVEQALNDARLLSPTKLQLIYSQGADLKGVEVDLLSPSAKPVAFDIRLPQH